MEIINTQNLICYMRITISRHEDYYDITLSRLNSFWSSTLRLILCQGWILELNSGSLNLWLIEVREGLTQ